MVIIKSFACISDPRIRKILKLLIVANKKVLYSGTQNCDDISKFTYNEVKYNVIKRKRTLTGVLKASFLDFSSLLKLGKNDTLYFIDELICFVLFPIILFLKLKNVNLVIDLFDSYYLKSNKNIVIKNLLNFLFLPFNKVIVTDENRAIIMSELHIKSKIYVIENFPFYEKIPIKKQSHDKINLFFYGSLSEPRGWDFIFQFKNLDMYQIYLAGWYYLKVDFNNLPSNFTYLGLLNQDEILDLMRTKMDWVFCMYKPINSNNINASPNKVYDAIHTGCGIIINSEVKLSNFVIKEKIGIVIKNYEDKIEEYLKQIESKDFCVLDSINTLKEFSFDKYLDFYKNL